MLWSDDELEDGRPCPVEHLTEVGIALSSERDTARLLEKIVLGAKLLTGADGGTLYVVRDGVLHMEIVRTDSLDYAMGGTTGRAVPFPAIPLVHENGKPNHQHVVSHTVLANRTVNIPDAYTAEGFEFLGTREFDALTGYRSRSFLVIPMTNHDDEIIGVLQLLNAIDPNTGEVVPFSADAERLAKTFASQASMTLTNRRLAGELRSLFDSLIQLIAVGIDAKSPHTAGHCRRVPVITMMMADAVHNTREGPFADYQLTDEKRYALEVAAWLHDCGKITTPEHLLNKSRKLETVCDRIEILEARFEILRRDLELNLLRQQLGRLRAGDSRPAGELEQRYLEELEALDSEEAFLRICNRGNESMSESARERIRQIARRTWVDHKGQTRPLLTPEEVDTLCVVRGTLTPGEKQTVNAHVTATHSMLEGLQFPRALRNVPEYAGGHHERVDGTGYPRGLRREEMSVEARMMAIADIFEALSAQDRPYRSRKNLSECLDILWTMSREGHIDPDLFDIFMREKVYLRYSREYLSTDQIDITEPLRHPDKLLD
ncbi:HD domain-containing protein [Thiohalomonas denitrificans]|uniref:HD domain-containing protein n=2 Tax=Thiohalomonas denitrificans TaxID=415747 RepID=A0A1G5Q9B6_9GAMM|nr:HD domain-containing protein [Thiohalomonas denitrificans]